MCEISLNQRAHI